MKIERTKPLKYSRLDYLRLDKNEKPYPLPKKIFNKMIKNISPDNISAYPEIYPLYEKLSKKLYIDKENILFTNGSDTAIRYIFETFLKEGDSIISEYPTYGMIPIYSKIFGLNHIKIKYDKNLKLNIKDIISKIKEGNIKLLYLSNPNNPTGSKLFRSELLELLEETRVHKTLFLLDEAYIQYTNDNYLDLIKIFKNLIIVRTFSKYYGLPGIRLGFILSNKKIIEEIYSIMPTFEVNSLTIEIAKFILNQDEYLDLYLKDIQTSKMMLRKFCSKQNLEFIDTYTNFAFIKFENKEIANKIMERLSTLKILVKSGFSHIALEKCIRFSIGNPEQTCILLDAIIKCVENYGRN